MSAEENKAAARAYFERLLNAGELAATDAIFLPQARFHYPLGEFQGVDQIRQYLAAVRTAFPDIQFVVEKLFEEADFVACRWTLNGTQTGEFRGNPPTGKRVEVPGNTIFQMSEGKIQEIWIAFNPALLL
jgi:steroid delta-isomerase-like uncharacterized protein